MFQDKTFLVVIPARSGSISILNKNLQKVGEHSLVGRSILHAKKCSFIDKIIVSTNGPEIKEKAERYEVEVIDRPAEISSATSSTESAIIHSLETLKERGDNYDYVVILQPTSPFRSEGLIDRCVKRIIEEEADSLLTCWKFHNFCFYKIIEGGIWHSTFDYQDRPMRQQLGISEWRSFDNGCVYATTVKWFLEHKCRLGGKISIEPTDALDTIQIDEMEDLIICQKIASGEIK